jgi:iron complex transport system ATP-binding protein
MSISVSDVHWATAGVMIVNGVTSMSIRQDAGAHRPERVGKIQPAAADLPVAQGRSGVIALGDTGIDAMTRHDIARRVAFVEQQATTDAQVTVLDVVRLGRTPHRGPLVAVERSRRRGRQQRACGRWA